MEVHMTFWFFGQVGHLAATAREAAFASSVGAIVVVALTACAETAAKPSHTATDQATFMERTRCGTQDDEATIAAVINGSAVQNVRPLYSDIENAKAGLSHELRGATITVAALPGVTPEWLDRALECHSAKETLGHAPAPSNDPFWLPDSLVDIEVRSAKDGFLVDVIGYSSADAKQILDRANAFAKAK
jgi:hypothetical protein